jgi:hypothetical protein
MTEPALFDVVELLEDLPEQRLQAGDRGVIMKCYPEQSYEVEFSNSEGETLALVVLARSQIRVLWQARTKTWVA